MKNSREIFRELQKQITLHEDAAEIQSMLYRVLETELGLSRSDILAEKLVTVNETQWAALQEIIKRINRHEPVQYILGETFFFGRKFNVTPSVLIPRPETELLAEEALKESIPFTPGTIVDVGTGSGCIAITLSLEMPEKKITGIDVSKDALAVARKNAAKLNATSEFQHANVLTEFPFYNLEMIVSNPPYVALSEKKTMTANVLEYEPHLALFVADHDPLIFYKVIAQRGFSALNPNGKVIVEINERFGNDVADIFHQEGFRNIRIIKDLQNKDRIVSAVKR